jgi:hypothetical protein
VTGPGFGSLDPLDANVPGLLGGREHALSGVAPGGASGRWDGGWSAVLVPRDARTWAAGWSRDARCPPDRRSDPTPGGRGWRLLGAAMAPEWREVHADRARLVRLLRRAGYVARWRWARGRDGTRRAGAHVVARWTYRDGPAAGCEAVDPWILARRLSECSASWYAQARITRSADLRVVAQPRPCGQGHVCPSCASWRSWTLATALRSVVEAARTSGEVAGLALVTLTHRDIPGRSLREELGRLLRAWHAMTRGRAGMEWRARVPSWFYGVEVTRGQEGKRGDLGHGWHAHLHVIIGADSPDVARWIGERWHATSEAASTAEGTPGYGWLPGAGKVWDEARADGWIPACRPGWTPDEGHGWYRSIGADLGAVYQAAKYPTPAVELHPVALAEFISVAHGRRWHDGGGAWRGVRARAAALEAAAPPTDAPGYDVGTNVSRAGPRDAPTLDSITPGLGMERCRCGASGEHTCGHVARRSEWAHWRLTSGADRDQAAAAATSAGGMVEGPRLYVPREAAARLLREWHAATKAARETRAALDATPAR